MFGEQFYPTPSHIIHKMLSKISKDASNFLDPSAGSGKIAEAILEEDRYRRSRRVDCIESDHELISMLIGKGLTVVGNDWLTYSGVCFYSAIVMNPPFADGARHLLRAWDFMYDGEIVCLLNEETIDNPCTRERLRLAGIIAKHGNIERLGQCFRSSDRHTDVSVVLVYLKKECEDDRIELWSTTTEERNPDEDTGPDDSMLAIRDELGNLEHYYNRAVEHMLKAFQHSRKSALFMEAGGLTVGQDYERLAGMGVRNLNHARAEFIRFHRKQSWDNVFDRMQFHKWLDKKQREQFLRDIELNANIPFTADNIKGTLENVIQQRARLFQQSVVNVFDELTRYYNGNTSYHEGWKTNDSYKVNEKIVFPYGCRFDNSPYFQKFDTWYGSSSVIDLYNDLDRVLCVLSGLRFEEITTIGRSLDWKFRSLGNHVKAPFDNKCTSQFFDIKFWKKGTVHLKWLDRTLWQQFNITASAGKKWIGENTQQDKSA